MKSSPDNMAQLPAPDGAGVEGGGAGLSSCHHHHLHMNSTLVKLLLT